MTVRFDIGQWMVTVPGTPFGLVQHFIPPKASTRAYALSHAYVAPCSGSPLCIPADRNYRQGIPLCEFCSKLTQVRV